MPGWRLWVRHLDAAVLAVEAAEVDAEEAEQRLSVSDHGGRGEKSCHELKPCPRAEHMSSGHGS